MPGTGRPCTELMAACRGRVLAKVGAEGVYSAALPEAGLGVALKVEDGDGRCGPVALLAVLAQLAARRGLNPPPRGTRRRRRAAPAQHPG